MNITLKRFLSDDCGAVTVDWIVLTAAVVGLGLGLMTAIASSLGDVTDVVNEDLGVASTMSATMSAAIID